MIITRCSGWLRSWPSLKPHFRLLKSIIAWIVSGNCCCFGRPCAPYRKTVIFNVPVVVALVKQASCPFNEQPNLVRWDHRLWVIFNLWGKKKRKKKSFPQLSSSVRCDKVRPMSGSDGKPQSVCVCVCVCVCACVRVCVCPMAGTPLAPSTLTSTDCPTSDSDMKPGFSDVCVCVPPYGIH